MRADETAIAPSRRGVLARGPVAWARAFRLVWYLGHAVGAVGANKATQRQRVGSCERMRLRGGVDSSSSLTRLLPLHLMRIGLLLHHLAMQVDVETFDLDGLADPEAHDDVDHLEDDEGHDGAVHERAGNVVELDQHLMGVTVD